MDTNFKARGGSWWSKPTVLVVGIFLLGASLFLPTLNYDFVWDDFIQIKGNPQIKSLSNWPQLLVSKVPIDPYSLFYRPLYMLSFCWDYALFKENPWGYHLTNTILHGLNSSLVTYLALLLLQNPYGALIAGALFALHPAHPEAVAFIAGRVDLVVTLFSLLALIAIVKKPKNSKSLGYSWSAPLFFFLALLSKETAGVMLIPMAILVYQKSMKELKKLQAMMLKILPLILMLIPYLVLRHQAVKITQVTKLNLLSSPFFLFELFLRYLSFLIFPPQRASYFNDIQHSYPKDAKFLLLAGLTFTLLALIIYISYRQRDTMLFFSLLILPCLPSLGYGLYNNHIMIERYLYLPTVGLALLTGWGWLQIPPNAKKWAMIGLILMLAAYGGATLWRTPLWKDGVALFEGLKKERPSSPFIRAALGEAYMAKNRLAEAYEELSLAVKLEPYDPSIRSALGQLYLRLGWTESARKEFAAILKIFPNFSFALEGMGLTYMQEGNFELALQYLNLAQLADPQSGSIIANKTLVLSKLQNREKHNSR